MKDQIYLAIGGYRYRGRGGESTNRGAVDWRGVRRGCVGVGRSKWGSLRSTHRGARLQRHCTTVFICVSATPQISRGVFHVIRQGKRCLTFPVRYTLHIPMLLGQGHN